MKFNKYDYETISSNSQNKPISTPPWPREEQNNQHTSELNNSFLRPDQSSQAIWPCNSTCKLTPSKQHTIITQEKLANHRSKLKKSTTKKDLLKYKI